MFSSWYSQKIAHLALNNNTGEIKCFPTHCAILNSIAHISNTCIWMEIVKFYSKLRSLTIYNVWMINTVTLQLPVISRGYEANWDGQLFLHWFQWHYPISVTKVNCQSFFFTHTELACYMLYNLSILNNTLVFNGVWLRQLSLNVYRIFYYSRCYQNRGIQKMSMS